MRRHDGSEPFVQLLDCGRVDLLSHEVFARLVELLSSRMAQYAALIRRQAVVHPRGLPGAAVAGFYDVLRPTYPVSKFATLREALAWLEQPIELAGELQEIARRTIEAPWLLPEVRQQIEAHVGTVTVGEVAQVAQALGLSTRQLQRELSLAGTNFQSELTSARVRIGQQKMLATDLKLTAIALEVGCSSLQHFSALFRRVTGETPSAWRSRNRPGANL